MTELLEVKRELELAVLRGAEDYLEAYGWCQGSLQSDEGRYCIMGALNASVRRYEREHYGIADIYVDAGSFIENDAAKAADDLVEKIEKKYVRQPLIQWNDTHERTEADVMKLLADMIQERENTDEGS